MQKSDKRYAVAIGIGLALFPLHNQWLTTATAVNGQPTVFLPIFGTAIWVIATLLYLRDNWNKLDLGPREVYIPLFIIAAAISLTGITASTIGDKVAPLFMALSMLALYMVSRRLGKDIFVPLAIGAAIASLGVVLYAILHPGVRTGGYVFEQNYDIVVGYVLLATAIFVHRWQWLLAGLALVAMFLSGSPEAVFSLGILGLVLLIRRDWSKKLVITLAVMIAIADLVFALGYGKILYNYTKEIALNQPTASAVRVNPDGVVPAHSTLELRWALITDAMRNLKPLGTGYNLTAFNAEIVHNVPMIIVQQLGWPGILAGLAWLWVTIWCLVKTRLKYAFVLMLSLSVFDHFVWTQLAPWWWAVAGVATANSIPNDLIYKKVAQNEGHGRNPLP